MSWGLEAIEMNHANQSAVSLSGPVTGGLQFPAQSLAGAAIHMTYANSGATTFSGHPASDATRDAGSSLWTERLVGTTINVLGVLAGVAIVAVTTIALPLGVNAQEPVAQKADAPAQTYREGYWQPIARVSKTDLLKIDVVNQTRGNLALRLSGTKNLFADVKSGATTQLLVDSFPIFLGIDADGVSQLNLRYKVVQMGDTLKVQVLPSPDAVGERGLNIDETGAVYVY